MVWTLIQNFLIFDSKHFSFNTAYHPPYSSPPLIPSLPPSLPRFSLFYSFLYKYITIKQRKAALDWVAYQSLRMKMAGHEIDLTFAGKPYPCPIRAQTDNSTSATSDKNITNGTAVNHLNDKEAAAAKNVCRLCYPLPFQHFNMIQYLVENHKNKVVMPDGCAKMLETDIQELEKQRAEKNAKHAVRNNTRNTTKSKKM